eukprot:14970612-Ditylum_brightwellii.AAC.1
MVPSTDNGSRRQTMMISNRQESYATIILQRRKKKIDTLQPTNLDLCRGETAFIHNVYGETGSEFVGQVRDKPGVTKSRQIILMCNVGRVRPHAYLHHHNLHKLTPGWTRKGQYEKQAVLEKLNPVI